MIVFACACLVLIPLNISGQSTIVQGHIRDSGGKSVPGVTVRLERMTSNGADVKTAVSDQTGSYSFDLLRQGSYSLKADSSTSGDAETGPFSLEESESKTLDLVLKTKADSVQFFDEPKFTVAGVTDHTYVGGHGSDAIKRSAEELTKATSLLSKDPGSTPDASKQNETRLRAILAGEPGDLQANEQLGALLSTRDRYAEALAYLEKASQLAPRRADLHHAIAKADEGIGKPLEAVHEYQRAAELDASESNLYDWGTELLVHLAPEAALEVFQQGIHLFPSSSRMLLGAGTALYSRGEYGPAAEYFFRACDLHPDDPDPYLFLGKVHSSEIAARAGFLDRMERFAQLQPANAWAHYYYAVSLWAQQKDGKNAAIVQSLLARAVRINPQLAAAYLQLGIVAADQQNFSSAIVWYQKAIEIDSSLEQAHYRLAQAYRQTHDIEKAREEDERFRQLSKTASEELAKDRSELQRFVINLKEPASH